jgi:hypothetical protein
MYDGVFDAPSIYRGQPTREKDEEWMKLENSKFLSDLESENVLKETSRTDRGH